MIGPAAPSLAEAGRPAAGRPAGTVPPSVASPVRLFQIGGGWFPERKGGAENVYYNLYLRLARSGFDIRGVVPGSDLAERDTQSRIRSFAAQGVSLPRRAMAVRRILQESFREAGTELVTAHFALYALPVLDRLAGLPLVVHFHGPWAMESLAEREGLAATEIKKAIERLVYRRAQRIIVLSDDFGRILQERYHIRDSVLRRIPGAVDCERFATRATRSAARQELGWPRDRPVLLTVRRLVRRMGLENLIEAIALLRRSGQDAVLYIAGIGPERDALEARAAERGLLGENVHFTGLMPDQRLPLAYRAADITVVPSSQLEGFGLIAVESLAAGTPALVTPVGGLPEAVAGLSEKLVLSGTRSPEIAAGLAAALSNPSMLPDAEACRRYALATYDWSVVIPRVAAVYREVL